jgi:hypothetical protein
MKKLRWTLACCVGILLSALPAGGADFEYRGKIEAQDPTSCLLRYYVDEFTPEELFLCIDEQPDDTGRFRELYMDLTGVFIDEVRVDKLTFRMRDVRFNAPSEWVSGNVKCKDVLQIYAECLLKEEDINRKLATETFGKDDHWQRLSMKISPSGLYARGFYVAKVLFVTLNIAVEIESGLQIVGNKELWLSDYEVRVNSIGVPEYITKKAINQIQPLLDLGRLPLPLKLHRVTFQEKQAVFSTRLPPEPLLKGVTYRYQAQDYRVQSRGAQ